MLKLPLLFLVVSLPFLAAGCVNGKLDPRVAPVAAAIGDAACGAAPLVVKVEIPNADPVKVGEACKGFDSVLQNILDAMSAKGLPKGAALGAENERVELHVRGVAVARVHRSLAHDLQAELDQRVAAGAL